MIRSWVSNLTSFENFVKGTTAKVANLPQNEQSEVSLENFQSLQSPTAIPRILEEESQAECKTSCREQVELESTFEKVDSSPKAESPQARADLDSSKSLSDSKILDEKCGLQGKSQGSYLSGSDRRDFSPLPHLSSKAQSPQVDSSDDYSAPAESNQINGARKACNLESVQGDWGAKGVKKRGIEGTLRK